MVVGYDKDLQRKSEAGKSLHCINLSPLILLNNAAVPQGSWSVVFLGGFFHPAQAAQPVSYALEGKERQRKIPYFYDPLGGSLIIIPVTDQNWELLILILVTFHLGGTVSTSQGQGWLHRQTTNQRQLLQMPCKCHTSQSDVKYWSGSAKRLLTPNCSTISLICLPDIGELLSHASFFWHAISHFSRCGLRTRGRWSVTSVCSASHVPLQSY